MWMIALALYVLGVLSWGLLESTDWKVKYDGWYILRTFLWPLVVVFILFCFAYAAIYDVGMIIGQWIKRK